MSGGMGAGDAACRRSSQQLRGFGRGVREEKSCRKPKKVKQTPPISFPLTLYK